MRRPFCPDDAARTDLRTGEQHPARLADQGRLRHLVLGAVMQRLRTAMLAMTCAVAMVSAMTYVSAQRGRGAPRMPSQSGTWCISRHRATTAPTTSRASSCSTPTRTTVFSNASRTGCRRPRCPARRTPGIAVSVPLQMLYVTSDGWMKAIDLATDQIAWTFNGETRAGRADEGRRQRLLRASLDAAGRQDAGGGLQLQLLVVLHRRRHRQESWASSRCPKRPSRTTWR